MVSGSSKHWATSEYITAFLDNVTEDEKKKLYNFGWICEQNLFNQTRLNDNCIIIMNTEHAYNHNVTCVADRFKGESIIHLDFTTSHLRLKEHPKIKESLLLPFMPGPYVDLVIAKTSDLSIRKNIVTFPCHRSPYRIKTIKELQDAGVDVHVLTGCWGNSKVEKISASKALINIHVYGEVYKFEHIRCDPWILAGFPVISQTSSNQEELDIKDLVVFVDMKDMAEKIKYILDNYDTFLEEHKKKYDKLIGGIVEGRKAKLRLIQDVLAKYEPTPFVPVLPAKADP